ncbi:DUF2927 domain-containing protein [Sediminimonas sp.]|uniref:DUF2927 domain-containing protein n=1 Tax=Sediminimonas sp. TaxID=2823379 RepID=UPI0025CC942D|nr:DUF2927 domain-containing protein [Sediminimonas sp.]
MTRVTSTRIFCPGRLARRLLLAASLSLAAACMPAGTPPDGPTRAARATAPAMPAMKSFSSAHPQPSKRANADIARDFLDLSFQLESGRTLPRLTRFEAPIRVGLRGDAPAHMRRDLDRLLVRLRREAGLDIALAGTGETPNLTVAAISREDIRRFLPQAACFVVPGISRLSEYRNRRWTPETDWAQLAERRKVAIFVPSDAPPQEIRDCLQEELAQALGPLNDLYRLPDSVFNDDNVHAVLTGFDMLILRAYYAPELQSGMSRAQVARRLPAILARLNPPGENRPPRPLPPTPRAWINAMETALGRDVRADVRRRAARRAVAIARAEGWADHRAGFAHYALGRLLQAVDAQAARRHFDTADRIFTARPDTELHRAHLASHLAAHDIAVGNAGQALERIAPALVVAARAENAALMSTLMMLRAEALAMTRRVSEARSVRLDSLGWARYGFGPGGAVRAKLREIAALNPASRSGG